MGEDWTILVIEKHLAQIVIGALLMTLCDSVSAGVRKDVQFNQGELSAAFQGTVSPDDHDRYYLVAKAGQQLRLQLQSSSGNGVFNLHGPGYLEESNSFVAGKSMQYEATTARVVVKADGTHLIDVGSLGGATSYRMIVTIDGAAEFARATTGGNPMSGLASSEPTGETKDNFASPPPIFTSAGNSSASSAEQTVVTSVAPLPPEVGDSNPGLEARASSSPPTVVETKREELSKPVPSAAPGGTNGFFAKLGTGVRVVINALGLLLLACGVLSCCAGGMLMPKPDRRFKTGYKDNEVVTWQFRAMAIGVALGAAGVVLSQIAV